ncbi:MAG: exopolysaccharide biosynthesis polyprenyl glycosylphosphotransferase [Terriglobales bacterium]
MSKALQACLPPRMLGLAITELVLIGAALTLATRLTAAGSIRWPPMTAARIVLACGVVLLCLHYYDLYSSPIAVNPREVAVRLTQVLGTACVVLSVLYFADPWIQLRWASVLGGTLLTGLLLAASRAIFIRLVGSSRLAQRVLFVGAGPVAAALAAEMVRRPEMGLSPFGYVGEADSGMGTVARVADASALVDVVRREHIDRVLAVDQGPDTLPIDLLLALRHERVLVEDAAQTYEAATGKVALAAFRPASLYAGGASAGDSVQRAASLLFAWVLVVPALPLMALIAAAIRWESPGPAIFRQQRVGQGGCIFTLFKFRTLRHNADAGGAPRPVERGDPRLTRIGGLLRRCRLDELPQLWNVLRGEINLVGPRPFAVEQERWLAAAIPYYRYRWLVRPGITGWAQIQNGYCASLADNAGKLASDLFYIKHRSFGLDLMIMFLTLKILLLGRGAR